MNSSEFQDGNGNGHFWEVNGRRAVVQIGRVLRRFPFLKALKPARHSVSSGGRTAVKIGDVLPMLSDKLYGVGGS